MTGHKIKIQSSVAFPYAKNKLDEKLKNSPIYNYIKKKYLGINLTKHGGRPLKTIEMLLK